MTYINSAQGGDDATTYKGKIDESLNLLREPPVTGGSGSAYTVADWSALTFANDTVYYAKAHTANTGACTIDSLSIVNLDSSALSAGQIQQNHVMKLLYQSSGTKFLLLNPSNKTLTSPTINSGAVSGTFTGNSTFSGTTTFSALTVSAAGTARQIITGAIAQLRYIETGVTADNGAWDVTVDAESMSYRVLNDALDSAVNWLKVDRTDLTVDTINLTATNVQANGVNVATNSTSSIHTVQQIELGHASDTTLTRSSAGVIAVEGVTVPLNSTTSTHTAQQIELGHASDTTITRPAAGRAQIEGREIVTAAASATQLTATIDELNKNDDSAAAVSGYVSGMRAYIHEDGANSTSFDVDSNITEDTFESIGPTGAGATNTWTALNDLPSSARIATIAVQVLSPSSTLDSEGSITVYARKTGSSASIGAPTFLSRFLYVYDDNAAASQGMLTIVDVPLDSSRRFDLAWAETGLTGSSILIYLKGFKV